jgi:hydrogenase maturation protease
MRTPLTRVLCLGNELLGDDGVGPAVAEELRRAGVGGVVARAASGLQLLDDLDGVDRLIVVDAVQSGLAPPGKIWQWEEGDLLAAPSAAPHGLGLLETLDMARVMGLAAPREVKVIAVEAADCRTMGAPMSAAVRAAIPRVVTFCRKALGQPVYFGSAKA